MYHLGLECANGGASHTSGRVEDGKRVPTEAERHELQRKNQRTHGEVYSRNGKSQDQGNFG